MQRQLPPCQAADRSGSPASTPARGSCPRANGGRTELPRKEPELAGASGACWSTYPPETGSTDPTGEHGAKTPRA
eukprot:14275329-Alexandrium_andersonii.AAC.1